MRSHIQIIAILLYLICINVSLSAQTKDWKTQKTDDGSVTVKSCISEQKNLKGDIVPLIEYTATAIMNVDMQKCISVIKDVPKHKLFLKDIKESKTIKPLSENQTVVYYSFNAPWPFSDYDCVTKMDFIKDSKNNAIVFTLVSAPSLYKRTDNDRLTQYEINYCFQDLKNGKVEITITGKMSPPINIPLWMLRRTMPDRPAETLHKIVTLANKI